jgi:hypothetical protein
MSKGRTHSAAAADGYFLQAADRQAAQVQYLVSGPRDFEEFFTARRMSLAGGRIVNLKPESVAE